MLKFIKKNKNGIMSFFIFMGIIILMSIFVLRMVKGDVDGEVVEKFEMSNKPTILFIYGKKNGENKKKLKQQFEDDYKDYNGYLDVIEYDVNKKSKDDINNMKINPAIEYEIRYYPESLNNLSNYTLYIDEIGNPLNDFITQLENKQEDVISEEESPGGLSRLSGQSMSDDD